jgi:hypothetical protein
MSTTDKFKAVLPQSTAQAGIGLLLLAMMAGGGTYMGLRIEPEECADARTQVAVCEEREAASSEALEELRATADRLRAERDECTGAEPAPAPAAAADPEPAGA